jgi:hypothetical protein
MGYNQPYGSVNWDENFDLLQTAAPFAWWVTGGNKNCQLTLTLFFQNGQKASLTEKGHFSVMRPNAIPSRTSIYVDYVMFTPATAGSISVPLGKVTWETHFATSYPSTNISPNSVIGPIGPDSSTDWPVWTNVFSNPNN